ncbi:MAG: hypothetical protein M5U01_17600 [Ardenticatenaceae bacterium]|nr:hypothetical protein [Ardenticatenaceae bacterium]
MIGPRGFPLPVLLVRLSGVNAIRSGVSEATFAAAIGLTSMIGLTGGRRRVEVRRDG